MVNDKEIGDVSAGFPLEINPLGREETAMVAGSTDWVLVLVMDGSLSGSPRLRSLQAPYVACLLGGEKIETRYPCSSVSGYSAVFRPQLVNESFRTQVPLEPDSIEDIYERRDAELVQPFARDSGLCRELAAHEADFLSMLLRNARELSLSRDDPYWSSRSRHYFLEVLNFLLPKETSFRQNTGAKARQVYEFIHGHYQEKMTLDMLAGKFGTNRTTLQKLFKNEYKINVFGYIANFRIQMAKQLMKETDLTMKEIGYRIGFNDYSHFFRVFTKLCGESPVQYLRDMADGEPMPKAM